VSIALVSVSDKRGLDELVAGLVACRAIDRIVASGGTARYLRDVVQQVPIV
jgi:AICAR transformylase/IMP cyclohydrolase PurH